MKSFFLLFVAIAATIAAVLIHGQQQQALPNMDQQTALCTKAATLLWKVTAAAELSAGPTIYTPPSLSDDSGENTFVLLGTNVVPNKPNTGRFYSFKALYPDITWQNVMDAGVGATAVVGGPIGNSVYFGDDGGAFTALNADTGVQEWVHTSATGARFDASPLYVPYLRHIFVGDSNGGLICLDADQSGKVLWTKTLGDGGAIYDQPLYFAFMLWQKIFVGNSDGVFYALRPSSGAVLWSKPHDGGITSTPAVVNGLLNPTVVVCDNAGYVTLYDMDDGTVMWKKQPSGTSEQLSSPVVGYVEMKNAKTGQTVVEQLIFYGAGDGKVYALYSANGTTAWTYTTGKAIASTPALSTGVRYTKARPAPPSYLRHEKYVYIGSNDKNVYQLDAATGKKLFNYTTGDRIYGTPAIDKATGVLYFTSLDKSLYAIVAEPTCLPACQVPSGSKKDLFGGLISNVIVNGSIDLSMQVNDDTAERFQKMPGVSDWSSLVQSVVYHPESVADEGVSGAQASTTGVGSSSDESTGVENHYYSFFSPRSVFSLGGLMGSLSAASPDFSNSANSAEAAAGTTARDQQRCSWTMGCAGLLPCVRPALPAKEPAGNPNATWSVTQLSTFYNSCALHALFEYAVALVTTRNVTLAQHVFSNRVVQAEIDSAGDLRGDLWLRRAHEIVRAAQFGFVCSPESRTPHFYLTSRNFTFDATSYARDYDTAAGQSLLGRSALNALGGGHTFLSACACSSCAPYFSADNNAVPWLFLLAAAVKTVLVSFKLVPFIAALRKYFLRRRTHGDLVESGGGKDGNGGGSPAAPSGTRDPVAVLRAAQQLRSNIVRGGAGGGGDDEESDEEDDNNGGGAKKAKNNNTNKKQKKNANDGTAAAVAVNTPAVVFHGLSEVRRRLQSAVGLEQTIGSDFVRFYMSQFSSNSASFESSTVATPWDRDARREKILDVVVPNSKAMQHVAALLAPLDRCFEDVLDERCAESNVRESRSFSGKMSNLFRFTGSSAYNSTTASYRESGVGGGGSKAPLLGGGGSMRRSMNSGAMPAGSSSLAAMGGGGTGYGATGGGDDDDDHRIAQQPAAYNYDYNEQQQQPSSQHQLGDGDADAKNTKPSSSATGADATSQQQQQQQQRPGTEQKKLLPNAAGGVSLREIRAAIKAFRSATQEHPEWFDIITVVSHRLPKNPFLPSRLILALGALYTVIYYFVSLADAVVWTDQALLLTHQDGGWLEGSAAWQRYEGFGWRVMNSTLFPLLFVNCLFAHFQYMMATTSETGDLLKQLRSGADKSNSNNSKKNSSGHEDVDADDDGSASAGGCFVYIKALLQHFEGRVACLLFLLALPFLLTHCIPSAVMYIWLIAPVFFFFIVAPAVVIANYSRYIMYDEMTQQQQLQLQKAAAAAASSSSNSNAAASGNSTGTDGMMMESGAGYGSASSQQQPSAWTACCEAISLRDPGNRARLVVYICYIIIYFFVCALVSFSYNSAALGAMYKGDGTVHFVDPENGRRYASAIKWDIESRSPVCGTIAFFWSASAAMRNLALFVIPF